MKFSLILSAVIIPEIIHDADVLQVRNVLRKPYTVADEDFQVKEFLLMRCCLRICLNKMLSFREEAMYETMQTSDKLTDS